MQATIKFRKPDLSDTGSKWVPAPLPSPISVHVIKASDIGALASVTLRKVVWAKIITHTLSRLVCLVAAAISCEDRP